MILIKVNETMCENKRNFQKELEAILNTIDKDNPPTLLLHSCCGPCSSYCLEYLSEYFKITVLYYNPNIYPSEEFEIRAKEQEKFIEQFPSKNKITYILGNYNPDEFYEMAKGLENLPEGDNRCFKCYRQRLEKTAKMAAEQGFDYFTTTLSISPLKRSDKINEIGEELSDIYKVQHLPSDFKKKNGYKRSTELSKEYNMYRQDYCGCEFSYKARHPEG